MLIGREVNCCALHINSSNHHHNTQEKPSHLFPSLPMEYLRMFWVVLQLLMLSILWKLFSFLVWRPYTLTKWFVKQGIRGPTYSLVSGCLEEIKSLRRHAEETVMDTDSNDIIPRVQPHYHKWLSLYGHFPSSSLLYLNEWTCESFVFIQLYLPFSITCSN